MCVLAICMSAEVYLINTFLHQNKGSLHIQREHVLQNHFCG